MVVLDIFIIFHILFSRLFLYKFRLLFTGLWWFLWSETIGAVRVQRPLDLLKVGEMGILLRTGYLKLICYVKEKAEQKLSPYYKESIFPSSICTLCKHACPVRTMTFHWVIRPTSICHMEKDTRFNWI